MRTTGLGPLRAQGCFQFTRGWQWQAGPAQDVCMGDSGRVTRHPVGLVSREGCGVSGGCALSRPGVNTGSVVLKEGEQVITAVCGEVGWTQVGEQFIRIGQFRKQIQSWF